MTLFNKEDNKKTEEKKEGSKKSPTPSKEVVFNSDNSKTAYDFLIEPWVTEKTHSLIGLNKYVFKVSVQATKKKIKMAVEGIYQVKIDKIAIVSISAKTKYFGRRKGTKSAFKKAIITLKAGDSIKLFQGA